MISPSRATKPVFVAVSQATRELGRFGATDYIGTLIVVAMNAVTNKIVTILGGMAILGELLPAQLRCFDVVQYAGVEPIELRARALERDAGLKPREEINPVSRPGLQARCVDQPGQGERRQRQRHEHVRANPDVRASEGLGRNADDLERVAVDGERVTDDAGVGSKSAPPEVVGEHGDARLVDGQAVGARPGRGRGSSPDAPGAAGPPAA